jgi:hypothetical protein
MKKRFAGSPPEILLCKIVIVAQDANHEVSHELPVLPGRIATQGLKSI